jgi:hypothetical protein
MEINKSQQKGAASSPSSWSWMWSWGQVPSQTFSNWFSARKENEKEGRPMFAQQNDFIEQQFLETLAKQYNYDATSNKYTDKKTPKKSLSQKNPQASNSNQALNFMSVNDVIKKRQKSLTRTASNISEDDNSDFLFTLSTK